MRIRQIARHRKENIGVWYIFMVHMPIFGLKYNTSIDCDFEMFTKQPVGASRNSHAAIYDHIDAIKPNVQSVIGRVDSDESLMPCAKSRDGAKITLSRFVSCTKAIFLIFKPGSGYLA